jgi:hypothetical protein
MAAAAAAPAPAPAPGPAPGPAPAPADVKDMPPPADADGKGPAPPAPAPAAAGPKPLSIQQKCALILIDVQKGFLQADHWGGGRNNPNAEKAIGALLKEWRDRRMPVLHVQHISTEHDSPLRPGQVRRCNAVLCAVCCVLCCVLCAVCCVLCAVLYQSTDLICCAVLWWWWCAERL